MEAVANVVLENVQTASACVLPSLGAIAEGKNVPQEECVPMSSISHVLANPVAISTAL